MSRTYTYTLLPISEETYEEIKKKLLEVGYADSIDLTISGIERIDMQGIALTLASDPEIVEKAHNSMKSMFTAEVFHSPDHKFIVDKEKFNELYVGTYPAPQQKDYCKCGHLKTEHSNISAGCTKCFCVKLPIDFEEVAT